ncbi:ABC transporter permease [Spiroplasma sabaudiense]|uniref:ABC transporter permease n=1 Tax=Spiroplasma sabaudiense TaxID=216944 RepID=UPI0011DD4E25|nr:FtsX-like permease family protein [Spiroplasma sabaudiense]
MRKSNGILLLKQSLINILKFRVQFIIVIVLSFLSASILTVSMGINSTLNNNFQEVVGKGNQFDFEYQYQFNQRRNVEGPNQTIPLNAFVNNNYSTFIKDLNEKDIKEESAFNFILSSQSNPESNDNFLIRTYQDQNFQNAIYEQFKNDTYGVTEKLLVYDYDANQDEFVYNPTGLEWTFEPAFRKTAYEVLTREYKKDLGCGPDGQATALDYTRYTPAGIYTMNNGCSWVGDDSNSLNVYMNYAFQNLIKTNFTQFGNFFKFLVVDQIINKLDANQKPTKQIVTTKFNETNNSGTWSELDFQKGVGVNLYDAASFETADKEENARKLTSLFYEYILGYSIYPTNVIHSNFLGDWINQVKASELISQNKEEDKNFLKTNNDVYKYGRRGHINPIVISVENNLIQSNKWLNDHWAMTGLPFEEPSNTTQMNLHQNFYERPNLESFINQPQDSDSVRSSMFINHQKLIGEIMDFDVNLRSELFYFDNESQSKVRAVAIDENEKDPNFTILKGSAPRAANEIAISQQYARKNKIKIGDVISVGGASAIVSGFATDKYSYYPMSDKDVPLPDNKNGLIIFGFKSTLVNIGISGFENYVTYYNSIFLTNKGAAVSKDARANLYSALLNNVPNQASSYYNYTKESYDSILSERPEDVKTFSGHYDMKSFKDSNYSLGWTVNESVLRIYNIVSIASVVIILLISLTAIAIGIAKTIRANMGQTINLKALGVKTSEIASSYLTYAIIVAIVVPIAWISGIFLQIPLANIFSDYLSAPYNVINPTWAALGIAFLIFVGIAAIVSFTTAFILTRGSILQLQEQKNKVHRSKMIDIIKNRWMKNSSFSKRFSLEMASSGSRQTWMVSSTIFISAFFIGGSLALPSIALNLKESYYKNIKYSNEYSTYQPMTNSPLSKVTLNTWKGQKELEADWKETDQFSEYGLNGYYSNLNNYTATTNNVGVLPSFIYTKDSQNQEKIDWSIEYLIKNLGDLVPIVSSIFGTNFYNATGQAFSIGELEQFMAFILQSATNPVSKKPWTNDEERLKLLKEISVTLTEGLGPILSLVMGSITDDGQTPSVDDDWKKQILDSIISSVPPYVKSYVNSSESRKNQFAFGYSFDQVVTDKETLATKLSFNTPKYSNLDIIGLPEDQKAFSVAKSEFSQTQFSEETHQKVAQIVNGTYQGGDIVENETKLYNASTKELKIPVIANRQAEAGLKFGLGDELSDLDFETARLTFKGRSGYENLPKGAWAYNNSDYKQINAKAADFLDPFGLDNNKFTYNESIKDGVLKDGAFVFIEWEYDEKGNITGSHLRPYYNYDNLELWFPENKINVEEFHKSDNLGNQGPNATWFDSNIISGSKNSRDETIIVPESAKIAWNENDSSTKWVRIRPYDLSFDARWKKPERNLQAGELQYLLNKNLYFMHSQVSGNQTTVIGTARGYDKINNNNLNKVSLVNVGQLNSFNSNIILGDQNIVNSLGNLSNTYFTPYDYNPVGSKANTSFKGIQNYNILAPTDLVKRELPKQFRDGYNGKINYWWNTKYSNIDETLGITSYVSFINKERTGQFAVGNVNSFKITTSYETQNLLSEKKALVNQISGMAVLIGGLLITMIIITSSLFIILICDLLVSKNSRFIILMKSIGYSRRQLVSYTLGVVNIFSILGFILGLGFSYLAIWGLISYLGSAGFAIPFALTWWAPFLAVILVGGAYGISIFAAMFRVINTSPHILTSQPD